jgi:hypothetical protein
MPLNDAGGKVSCDSIGRGLDITQSGQKQQRYFS